MALYRGMSSSIVRTGLFSSITFGAYSHFKELFHVTDQNYVSLNMVCATTSTGFVESLICCPLELIKIRMQVGWVHIQKYSDIQIFILTPIEIIDPIWTTGSIYHMAKNTEDYSARWFPAWTLSWISTNLFKRSLGKCGLFWCL